MCPIEHLIYQNEGDQTDLVGRFIVSTGNSIDVRTNPMNPNGPPVNARFLSLDEGAIHLDEITEAETFMKPGMFVDFEDNAQGVVHRIMAL